MNALGYSLFVPAKFFTRNLGNIQRLGVYEGSVTAAQISNS
jgi:hypothetical protein